MLHYSNMTTTGFVGMRISCPATGHGNKQLVISALLFSIHNQLSYPQDKIGEKPENKGSLFVPIILGSNKTTVSVATGHNEYWPLYGSIGNIHNNMHRAHGAGFVLIGFLAIAKGMSTL